MRVFVAGASGVIGPLTTPPRPRSRRSSTAGPVAVAGMTTQRAATNAKARAELASSPRQPSWRDGFRLAAAA
jgi:hypothetical protein